MANRQPPPAQPSTSSGSGAPNRGGDLFLRTQNGNDPINFYLDVRRTRSFRGGDWAQERTYRIEPQPNQQRNPVLLRNVLPQVSNMFDALLQDVNQRQNPQDFVRVYINHPTLQRAIVIPPRPLEDLTSEVIMNQVGHVLHSEENIPFDEDLDINIAAVRRVTGGGISQKAYVLNYERDRKTKKSVLTVPILKEDKTCLAKAVVIANAYSKAKYCDDEVKKKRFKSKAETLRSLRGENRLQQETEILMNSCNIPSTRLGCLDDIPFYEYWLRKSICVISSTNSNEIIYPGCKDFRKRDERLYLYHWKPYLSEICHFDVITNMSAFMGKADYCYQCDKAMTQTQAENHSCSFWCCVCQSKECLLLQGHELLCQDCNMTCRSKQCFIRHKKVNKNGKTFCSMRYKCILCKTVLLDSKRSRKHHVCGESYCSNCKVWTVNNSEKEPHRCFMRALSKSQMNPPDRFIFYDFESTQSEGIHIPNLVVAQTACSKCSDKKDVENEFCDYCGNRCSKCSSWNLKERTFEKNPCRNDQCGRREIVFRGCDVTYDFGNWILERQHKNCTFIAHNAKSYDNYFILNYFLQMNITPKVIFNGSKAVYMCVGKGINIRFLDSCMFLPMALAELPKCFDLEQLKKGYFPHFFNRPENYYQVFEKLPPPEDYGVNSMSVEKKDEFLRWYERNKLQTFDFEKEMLQYCRSDVDILRQACLVYRKLLLKVTALDSDRLSSGIDPFAFVSAASVCMGVFQARFLPETWQLAPKNQLNPDCVHDRDKCSCSWLSATKLTADSEFQFENQQKFSCEEIGHMEKQFLSSSIGLLNPSEYRPKSNYSLEAIGWLEDCQQELNETYRMLGFSTIEIQTALSKAGEKVVQVGAFQTLPPAKFRLDGYYRDKILEIDVALEFYGCHWHGCPKCHQECERRTKTLCHFKTLQQRYEETMIREERLKQQGFVLKTMWACEYAQKLLKKSFFSHEDFKQVNNVHISLRDCYFGGRTAATKVYHDFSNTAKNQVVGKYIDFTSLYPWAMKNGIFPIGHPERYTLGQITQKFPYGLLRRKSCDKSGSTFYNATKYCPKQQHSHVSLCFFGIAKVLILPPKTLLHPVLPYRCKDGKLVFPLCAKCSEENNQSDCYCCDKERSWVGTFCSGEIEAALDMGYEILNWYEILHWEKTSTKLFENYVNCFLQIKQEASGFPSNVRSEEEIEQYIQQYREKEGIKLCKDKIKKSVALRSLAKLMLNSLYGKFGQRPMLRKSHMVDKVEQLCTLMTAPSKTVVDFHVLSDNVMHIETEENRYFATASLKTNVTISAFTTSWARLKLWSIMQTLGRRLLYTDTDSLIYISTPLEPDIELGNYLGDLADELCCKKVGCKSLDRNCMHYIKEFVAGGPKNYAYVLNNDEAVCKIRGFTLDCSVSLYLNFSVLKTQVFDWLKLQKDKVRLRQQNVEYLTSEATPTQSNATETVVVTRTQITRNKRSFQIFNSSISKKYSVVLDKNKVLLDSFYCVPFGYQDKI